MGGEALSSSTTLYTFSPKHSSQKSTLSLPLLTLNFPYYKQHHYKLSTLSNPISCFSSSSSRTNATSTSPSSHSLSTTTTKEDSSFNSTHWIVVVKPPSQSSISKPQLVNYYVKTLERVLGSEEDAQMRIYNASSDVHFGFCCVVDEETSRELACLPEVLSVRPDLDFNSTIKDYSYPNDLLWSSSNNEGLPLFPDGNSKHWLVRVETPAVGIITRAQVVDYYVQILANVLGNEKDAQMCIYHVSWLSSYGFCCELDDECAKELADVPGVLSVLPDQNVESDNKDYKGDRDSSATDQPTNIKTKKLFVTGLSFYTSEKTLRAAFEGFGELVEVKIIMDKISKRSKGFAFIEYTTEEAASAALKEMNGKIINGWMIVVDVAKTNPPKYSRGRPRSAV